MPRPISDTVPDEIAKIIRANKDWGDLTGFAKKEGLKRSTVYSMILYRKVKTLLKLYRVALALGTTADEIYELLLIPNIIERKARFQLLMAKVGIEEIQNLAERTKISRNTISRYLNNPDAAKLFEESQKISQKMRISLHKFATIFATELE